MYFKRNNPVLIVLLLVFLVSCAPQSQVTTAPASQKTVAALKAVPTEVSQEVQDERDEIYILTAYAVVLNDWQTGNENKRGHNIGSVLVAPDGQIVNWARNCNSILGNGTQHGEVRLIMGYLNKVRTYSLKGHTVYTTLEPCAQCSGMMILTNIKRTVYGQTDPGFGGALERLELDSKKWNPDGYPPYPRPVISDRSKSKYCQQLDDVYKKVGGSITKFLLSVEAKQIYQNAARELSEYEVKYPENEAILEHARETLKLIKPGVPAICIKAHNH